MVTIDTASLAADVKAKREKTNKYGSGAVTWPIDRAGLRIVAKKVGVSHTALDRAERGGMPNLLTYARLCRWLGAPLDYYVKG